MTIPVRILLPAAALLVLAGQAFGKGRKPPATFINWRDVPAPIQATVQNNAGGGKVKEVQKGSTNGVVFYCVAIKGSDGQWIKVYVNEAGNLVKTEPDNARNKRKHKPLFGG